MDKLTHGPEEPPIAVAEMVEEEETLPVEPEAETEPEEVAAAEAPPPEAVEETAPEPAEPPKEEPAAEPDQVEAESEEAIAAEPEKPEVEVTDEAEPRAANGDAKALDSEDDGDLSRPLFFVVRLPLAAFLFALAFLDLVLGPVLPFLFPF